MTSIATFFLLVSSAVLLIVPRRWAPLPILATACYITLGQIVQIGPFHFTVLRILISVGIIRVLCRNEWHIGRLTKMDLLMLLWAACLLVAVIFHKDSVSTLINHLGEAYNALGIFFLIRCFCRSDGDVRILIRITALLLIPVAIAMLNEQITHRNAFSALGGVPETPAFREGRLRAQGPFRHAILAGTVGAVVTPLMVGIWSAYPASAMLGIAASIVMVLTCSSSGPITSLAFGVLALCLWRWRYMTKKMCVAAIYVYVFMDIVMKSPPYYLIARVDLVGGSTGWHRARLIESSIEHINEWWFAGTDYTRHWMPTGVSWSPEHTDITNHYLKMGVVGGLPLMIIFILIIWFGFRYVGETLTALRDAPFEKTFLAWALGCSLFAHSATMMSVSYFDQSFLFLYVNLAMILAMLCSVGINKPENVPKLKVSANPPFPKQKAHLSYFGS